MAQDWAGHGMPPLGSAESPALPTQAEVQPQDWGGEAPPGHQKPVAGQGVPAGDVAPLLQAYPGAAVQTPEHKGEERPVTPPQVPWGQGSGEPMPPCPPRGQKYPTGQMEQVKVRTRLCCVSETMKVEAKLFVALGRRRSPVGVANRALKPTPSTATPPILVAPATIATVPDTKLTAFTFLYVPGVAVDVPALTTYSMLLFQTARPSGKATSAAQVAGDPGGQSVLPAVPVPRIVVVAPVAVTIWRTLFPVRSLTNTFQPPLAAR